MTPCLDQQHEYSQCIPVSSRQGLCPCRPRGTAISCTHVCAKQINCRHTTSSLAFVSCIDRQNTCFVLDRPLASDAALSPPLPRSRTNTLRATLTYHRKPFFLSNRTHNSGQGTWSEEGRNLPLGMRCKIQPHPKKIRQKKDMYVLLTCVVHGCRSTSLALYRCVTSLLSMPNTRSLPTHLYPKAFHRRTCAWARAAAVAASKKK